LFLDGNNMMFVASCLRNMTLHRNKKRVEQLIARLAVQFLYVPIPFSHFNTLSHPLTPLPHHSLHSLHAQHTLNKCPYTTLFFAILILTQRYFDIDFENNPRLRRHARKKRAHPARIDAKCAGEYRRNAGVRIVFCAPAFHYFRRCDC
jgi:hypothetical protein